MNKFFAALLLTLAAYGSSVALAHEAEAAMPNSFKKAAVIKPFKGPFMLKEENLKCITNMVLASKEKLGEDSEFDLLYVRADKQFVQVKTLSQVLSESNTPGSQIECLIWQLRQDTTPNDNTKNSSIVLSIQYQLKNGVHLVVKGNEENWSLATAQKLESEIKRTLESEFNSLKLVLILTLAIAYFFFARFIVRLIAFKKFKDYATEEVINLNLLVLLGFPPMLVFFVLVREWDHIIKWFNKPSYFLWGDMLKSYNASIDINSKVTWCIVAALLVTITGNFLSRWLSKKKIPKKKMTFWPIRDESPPDGKM